MMLKRALDEVRNRPLYEGHLADGSSIQKHSAGSNYPYIMEVHELVELDRGVAQVVDSLRNVLIAHVYRLSDKQERLAAYELALNDADAFAYAYHAGVVR